jgi:hypothetical protein
MWILTAIAACSGDHPAGPAAPTCSSALASPVTLAVGAYVSIDPASDGGCVTVAANASIVDSAEYLLVPQSASGVPGTSSPFRLQDASLQAAAPLAVGAALAVVPRHGSAAVSFDWFLRRAAAARRYGTPPFPAAPRPAPAAAFGSAGPPTLGSLRTFTVCATLTCSSFKSVGARVQTLGAHIAIYVDTLAPANGLTATDLDSLGALFDGRLYPVDTTAFGRESDVDSNGVVIVLMTGVVNHLVTKAQCDTAGFIAGFFFSADLDPTVRTQYNDGEIFYAIVADPTGTLSCAHTRAGVLSSTPTTFVHEFQHMINFTQHVLVNAGNTEDGWLDEGLSKYAEELAGRSFLPGDSASFSQYAINDVFDAYEYLTAPGANPLLIPFDNGTLPEIGASWLFVRYAVDQYGDSLPWRLVHSPLVGAANVAAQAGQPFDAVVTHWALANWVSDLPGFVPPAEVTYASWHFRKTFASLNAQDPGDFPLPYPLVPTAGSASAVNLSGTLPAGSGVYHRALQGPAGAAFTLRFSRDGSAPLAGAVAARLNIIRIR